MARNRSYDTEEQAYKALAEAFWSDAPGELPASAEQSRAAVLAYLEHPDKVANASIALNFLGDDELLLAGNLIGRDRADEAWSWLDKSSAHAHLCFQVLDHRVWRPSEYTRQIFDFNNFCAHFALALARGDEPQIQWYAQQVYNLIQSGLADDCSPAEEYVDLYFDIAVSVLRNEWRTEDALAERMEVYRELFLSAGDEERVQQALLACAHYHLQLAAYIAPKNDDEMVHPYRTRNISHIAYELMAWIALYKRFHGALNLRISHPMLVPALVNPPPRQAYTDAMLDQLYANANIAFGEGWRDQPVPCIVDFE